MEVDGNGLEVLTTEECLELLRSRSFGRIAISSESLPIILPVHYVLADDEHLVIQTRRGTRLATATRNVVVAFEVDEVDDDTGEGWSVVVRGFASEYHPDGAPPPVLEKMRWLHGEGGRFVSVTIDLLSGRRTATASLRR